MSNISFYIPTVNEEDYNHEGIVKLFKQNFPDCKIQDDDNINVFYDNETVIYFWFEKVPKYIFDEIDEYEKELKKLEHFDSQDLKDILAFKELKLDIHIK